MLYFRYDTLLLQNECLKKQINTMNYKMKEKQKQIDTLQQKLLNLAGKIVDPDENNEKICRECWILTNET
ncbi:hypothetical protein CAJAP_03551 [Camponotus japonicus]